MVYRLATRNLIARSAAVLIVPAIFLSAACGGGSTSKELMSAQVSAPAPTSITLSPVSIELYPGEKHPFVATVTGLADKRVIWTLKQSSANADLGIIDSDGVYTAPAVASYNAPVRVTATSLADPSRSASATVTYRYSEEVEAVHRKWWANVADVASSYGCTGPLVLQQDSETTADVIARLASIGTPGSCVALTPISLDENTLLYSFAWGGTMNNQEILYLSDVGTMRIWNGKPVTFE